MSAGATQKQITEQAQAVANLAEAIAEDTLPGPRYAAVLQLKDMVDTLGHWIGDDR